jgi:outer membrane lipoprotein-sorting protein
MSLHRSLSMHSAREAVPRRPSRRHVSLILLSMAALTIGTCAAAQAASDPKLDRVLSAMDKAAAAFRSAEAAFEWDQFQKVVNDTDVQKGKVYYRRQGGDIQMAADITDPDKKSVLYSEGKISIYQPKIEQVTQYDATKNRAALESFLVLGFGGSGHDLLDAYEVKYAGSEQAGGVNAEKLELVPKSATVRNNVERIVLWIDPARGVSVQQQFFQPGGDYRLTKYSDIKVNEKIPDTAFKLKTTGKTKTVAPQG